MAGNDFYKISVQMEAENARLIRDLDKANRSLSKFERGARKSLDRFSASAKAAFGVLSVGAVVAATNNALDFADSIDKAAQRAGLSTDALQELRFAGEQVGLATNQLDDGMRRLTRRLGEFANSGGGPAAKALQDLNIATRDAGGNLRPTEAVFSDIVAVMEGIESQAQRSAYAAQLFGDDAGPQLELLLRQGVKGLTDLRQEARDVGAVLSDDLIANAVVTKDQFTKVSNILSVQFASAIVSLGPVLTDFANGMIIASREVGKFFDALEPVSNRKNIDGLREDLADVSEEITAYAQQIFELERLGGDTTGPRAIVEGLRAEAAALREQIALLEGVKKAREDADNAPPPASGAGAGDAAGSDKAADAAARAQQEFARALQALQDQLDPAAAKTRDYLQNVELLNRAWAEGQISGEQYDRLMLSLASDTETAARAAEEQRNAMEALLRTTIDAVDPNAALVRELEQLDQLMSSDIGAGFGDVILERMLQIQEQMDDMAAGSEDAFGSMSVYADEAARDMQDALADFLFDPFDEGLEGMLRGFADILRRMAAEAAAAEIFESFGKSTAGGTFWDAIGGLVGAIPGFADGTSYAPGGLALVGERGPELVNLPRGAEVIPNHAMNRVGSTSINVQVMIRGQDAERARSSAGQIGAGIARRLNRDLSRNG